MKISPVGRTLNTKGRSKPDSTRFRVQSSEFVQCAGRGHDGAGLNNSIIIGAFVAGGKGKRRSEEARVSEEAVKRKGGGAGPRELGTSQG